MAFFIILVFIKSETLLLHTSKLILIESKDFVDVCMPYEIQGVPFVQLHKDSVDTDMVVLQYVDVNVFGIYYNNRRNYWGSKDI